MFGFGFGRCAAGYGRDLWLNECHAFDCIDTDDATREERVGVPRAIELSRIACGVDIERSDFTQICCGEVLDLENAQACLIVRLIDEVSDDVHVVVDGGKRRFVRSHDHWEVEIHEVPHIGSGIVARLLFVEFVIHQEVALVGCEPSLVAVANASVGGA